MGRPGGRPLQIMVDFYPYGRILYAPVFIYLLFAGGYRIRPYECIIFYIVGGDVLDAPFF